MLQTRHSALRLSRSFRLRPQRRHDTTKATTGHSAAAGHAEPVAHAHHPEPANEPLGVRCPSSQSPLTPSPFTPPSTPTDLSPPSPQRGFYISLASLPLAFALYKFSRSSDDSSAAAAQPWLTRLIGSYSAFQERWVARNTLHTRMVEQAANDRNLFQSTPGSERVELKFPEIFNTGSPYNVQAGQTANLDELVAHYEKQNRDAEARVGR
ncbi:hypothetical protein MMC32_006140 [Xylographa parallela]|nr:hypothetical protein [Xylographa parallela]